MSLVRKFASVGGATAASRVLGFVREAMIGAALGAGPVADAFYAAFGFPNLFRRLFAEGAFNSAFVPLFAKKVEEKGRAEAKLFAEQVMAMLLAVLLVITALAMLFMPALVASVIAPKFADTPEKFDLTVLLTRVMFPYLAAMSLLAMLSGILNSLRKYFLAALAPVLLNVVLVGVLAVAMRLDLPQQEIGWWLAWGVMGSGLAQLALVAWAAAREGFFLRLRLPTMTPDVKRLMVLMGPAMLTGGVVQINIMVGRIIASAQDGAIALLNYADRINQLPLGIIGIAIGVVLLPELSRALGAGRDTEAVHLQSRSLEFALALTLPAAILFVVMDQPIVALLYERGAFSRETTEMTAAALAGFAVGLPAYVMIKVFQPAYFAREDMTTPFWFSAINVGLNIALSFALFPLLGHVAIALATALASWVQVALLAGTLWRRGLWQPSGAHLGRLGRILAAGIALAMAAWAATQALSPLMLDAGFATRAGVTLPVLLLLGFGFLALTVILGGIDRAELKGFLTRRRRA